MKLEFNISQQPKVTRCGLLWEQYDQDAPQIDHALCHMPWPAPPHYHERMVECYQIIGGQARIWVEGRSEMFEREDSLVIKPGQIHYTVPQTGSRLGRRSVKTSLEILVYNAPAWNSFDPFDFVTPSTEDPVWAQWYLDLREEISRRHRREWISPGMLAGKHWTVLVQMLCLEGYEDRFSQSGIQVTV